MQVEISASSLPQLWFKMGVSRARQVPSVLRAGSAQQLHVFL